MISIQLRVKQINAAAIIGGHPKVTHLLGALMIYAWLLLSKVLLKYCSTMLILN